MFPLQNRKLIRGCQEHIRAGLGCAADYIAKEDKLYLPFSGNIIHDYEYGGGNWLILIRDDNGDRVEFAHLDRYTVPEGHYEEGEIVAITGNTGEITTGPHLHIQIKDVNGKRLDPQKYNWNMKIKVQVLRGENPKHSDQVNKALRDAKQFLDPYVEFTDDNEAHIRLEIYDATHKYKGNTFHTGSADLKKYITKLRMGDTVRGQNTPSRILIHEILHILFEEVGMEDIHNYHEEWGSSLDESNEWALRQFVERYNSQEHFKNLITFPKMLLIRQKDKEDTFAIDDNGDAHLILNFQTFEFGVDMGLWDDTIKVVDKIDHKIKNVIILTHND